MGTEILYPQDYLNERMRFVPASSVYPRRNPNPKTCRKQAVSRLDSSRKRQTDDSFSSRSTKSSSSQSSQSSPLPLVMGQVTILKRGESLGSIESSKRKSDAQKNLKKTFSGGDLIVYGTERLGPEPERVPKIRVSDLKKVESVEYAGSACYNSPSPRALPLPKFSVRKDRLFVDDSATKDLRRLLRLD